jgi:hypothetical protein
LNQPEESFQDLFLFLFPISFPIQPPQFNRGDFQQLLWWNQPTKQSHAWKMNAKESQSLPAKLAWMATSK